MVMFMSRDNENNFVRAIEKLTDAHIIQAKAFEFIGKVLAEKELDPDDTNTDDNKPAKKKSPIKTRKATKDLVRRDNITYIHKPQPSDPKPPQPMFPDNIGSDEPWEQA